MILFHPKSVSITDQQDSDQGSQKLIFQDIGYNFGDRNTIPLQEFSWRVESVLREVVVSVNPVEKESVCPIGDDGEKE